MSKSTFDGVYYSGPLQKLNVRSSVCPVPCTVWLDYNDLSNNPNLAQTSIWNDCLYFANSDISFLNMAQSPFGGVSVWIRQSQ